MHTSTMSVENYRTIAGGWALLILFLTAFWFLTLRRLSLILRAHLQETGGSGIAPGLAGMIPYLFRGDYKLSGDPRLISVCTKLRNLLYAYFGAIGAFLVFIVIMHPS